MPTDMNLNERLI